MISSWWLVWMTLSRMLDSLSLKLSAGSINVLVSSEFQFLYRIIVLWCVCVSVSACVSAMG